MTKLPTQNLCEVCKHKEPCPFEMLGNYDNMCKRFEPQDGIIKVDTNLFDEVEIHKNCTVQILRNSVTGETSIGWWENDSSNDMGAGRT